MTVGRSPHRAGAVRVAVAGGDRRRHVVLRRDMLDGAVVAYLVLPVLLLVVCYLRTPATALCGLILAGVTCWQLVPRHREAATRVRIPVWQLVWFSAVGIVLSLFSGVAGGVRAPADWWKHNALLADLVERSWPVAYSEHGGASLVYSFGLHLPAAAVGKLFGNSISIAHICLGLWIALGYALVLVLLAAYFPARMRALLAVGSITLYSGAESLGAWVVSGFRSTTPSAFWVGSVVQYSSDFTLLRWVPQHAISGWLVGALYLGAWRRPTWSGSAVLVVASVTAAFWSPFVAIAGCCLSCALIVRVFRRMGRPRVRQTTPVLLHLLSVAPMLAFLSLPAGAQHLSKGPLDPWSYAMFIALSIGLWGAAAVLGSRTRSVLLIPLLGLLALPLFTLGQWNDLAMRTSIPFILVLVVVALDGCTRASRTSRTRSVSLALIGLAVIFGAPTAFQETSQAVTQGPTNAPVLPERPPWNESLPAYLIRSDALPGSSIWQQYLTCRDSSVRDLLALPVCRG